MLIFYECSGSSFGSRDILKDQNNFLLGIGAKERNIGPLMVRKGPRPPDPRIPFAERQTERERERERERESVCV